MNHVKPESMTLAVRTIVGIEARTASREAKRLYVLVAMRPSLPVQNITMGENVACSMFRILCSYSLFFHSHVCDSVCGLVGMTIRCCKGVEHSNVKVSLLIYISSTP